MGPHHRARRRRVVALTTDDKVVLARQFRPGPDVVLAELPGGYIEPGESPEVAAYRDLEEEQATVGISPSWDRPLCEPSIPAAIGSRSLSIARHRATPRGDPSEFCQTITMTLSEFRDHLRSGQLTDAGLGYMGLDRLGLLGP